LPYSGATGKTLRAWLARAGFPDGALHDPDRFYLTSLTKCFPGRATSGAGDRAPSRREIALCFDHLTTELSLVRPELVLALGRLSIEALLPSCKGLPLAELVGVARPAELPVIAGSLVLALPHPSGVSRWHNDPANRERLALALTWLATAREERGQDDGWKVLVHSAGHRARGAWLVKRRAARSRQQAAGSTPSRRRVQQLFEQIGQAAHVLDAVLGVEVSQIDAEAVHQHRRDPGRSRADDIVVVRVADVEDALRGDAEVVQRAPEDIRIRLGDAVGARRDDDLEAVVDVHLSEQVGDLVVVRDDADPQLVPSEVVDQVQHILEQFKSPIDHPL
jgi:uracil-DNA glycosylase family 4